MNVIGFRLPANLERKEVKAEADAKMVMEVTKSRVHFCGDHASAINGRLKDFFPRSGGCIYTTGNSQDKGLSQRLLP